MGGRQSTRKLTIDNDDPTNVIKVSDSVVERLRGTENAGAVHKPAYVPQTPSGSLQGPTEGSVQQHLMYPPSFTSLQVLQAKETELENNDIYWTKRLSDLEETHKKIDRMMEQEYNKAIDDVKQRFKTTVAKNKLPPCQDNKAKIIECYKNNPNRPMLCAKEVCDFAACVDQARATVVANRG